MEKVQQLYRSNYSGEDVKKIGLYIDNEWKYEEEYLSYLNLNVPLSNQAVVIGNGISINEFNLNLFLPSRTVTAWGEFSNWSPSLNKKKFNTYGCNALYRNFQPDFLIATGDTFLEEIAASDYCENNVVYANKYALPKYQNKFHYIPQDPSYNSGAIAAYLAAFDGHKKIFLLGFDGIDTDNNIYNVYAGTKCYPSNGDTVTEDYWVQSLNHVMLTYSDVEFVRVAPASSYRTPELWKYRINFRTISFHQFVLEADI